jgi:molybdenum cofactor cytidylyltransferase
MTLPVTDPPAERTGEATIAGILLAAGTSSRYGDTNKLLVEIDSVPIVRRSARALLDAGLDSVVVVLGYEADRVRRALAELDVTCVNNPQYDSGQASSVRAGLRAITSANGRGCRDPTQRDTSSAGTADDTVSVDAAVFALGDMPHVNYMSVVDLAAAYEHGAGTALAAAYRGRRGNPVLFDTRHFDDLLETSGDRGGRDILLNGDQSALVEVDDPGVVTDIDRPNDVVACENARESDSSDTET